MENKQIDTTYTKTEKLIKIERRAWKEFNINQRRVESKIMDEIRTRWENEVESITGDRYNMYQWSCGKLYSYNFGDIIA
jgi:hypothetical protein